MKFFSLRLPLIICLATASLSANADLKPIKPAPIIDIPAQWNKFVDDLLQLSNQLTSKTPHTKKHRIGGYSNEPEFYNETKYFSDKNNSLTSTIQREKRNTDAIHSIEVFLRDKNGRVYKDFSASYLTKHRNAPIQTLITLHYYNKDLHAFRVFDASHTRIYEVCRGKLHNKKVNIDLDDDYGELAEALEDKNGIMSTTEYKACFGGREVDKKQLNIPEI